MSLIEALLVRNFTARLIAVLLQLRDILPGFTDPVLARIELLRRAPSRRHW